MNQPIKTKIIVSNERADKEARDNWNKFCMIVSLLIDSGDKMKETNVYQKDFKNLLNRTLKEGEKAMNRHYKAYESHGEIIQPQEGLNPIHSRDVYNITSQAYEYLFNKSPHEICCIAELVRRLEAKGEDYTKIDIPFQPLK